MIMMLLMEKPNIKSHEADRMGKQCFKTAQCLCVFSWEGGDLGAPTVHLDPIAFRCR